MPDEVVQAMSEAASASVNMVELQAVASRQIAEATGAEAGYVTSGAAAGLTLGTAAILAGMNPGIMDRLPDTTGIANEMIISREHRNGYDHSIRVAGAKLIDVGMNEQVAGAGVRRTEAWEYEAAITDATVGIAYSATKTSQPPLEEVIRVAHEHGLPVLVDAAAQLPPIANLRRFIEMGVDLVAFSGGKALRGPQSAGIICGLLTSVVQSSQFFRQCVGPLGDCACPHAQDQIAPFCKFIDHAWQIFRCLKNLNRAVAMMAQPLN